MYQSITKNKIKTAFIIALVFGFLAIIAYYITYSMGYGESALVVAFVFSFMATFFSYWYSDKMVLSMSGARPANEEQDKIVKNALQGVCIASGMPMPKVYIMEEKSPNAFATGRNHKHAVVCVTTGLLEIMDYYQLEGVLAHELSHIKNYDMLLQTVVTVLVGAMVIISDMWSRTFWFRSRRSNDDNNNGSFGAIISVIGLIFLIIAPIAGQLMKMALSRNREYLADASAVEMTRNPEGLATALEKLRDYSRPVARANNATANLFISQPLAANGKASSLFATHPPIEKRIEAIRNLR